VPWPDIVVIKAEGIYRTSSLLTSYFAPILYKDTTEKLHEQLRIRREDHHLRVLKRERKEELINPAKS
jgi:hypothetical protein